jgi:hypothetical protein
VGGKHLNKFFSQAVIKGEQGGLQTEVKQGGKGCHPGFSFSKWVGGGGNEPHGHGTTLQIFVWSRVGWRVKNLLESKWRVFSAIHETVR